MKTNYTFEILALDSKGQTTIKSDKNLAFKAFLASLKTKY